MENNFNEVEYKTISSSRNSKKNFSFSKSVLIPFFCSGLATILVIGTCFRIPSIKNKLIGDANLSNSSFSFTQGNVSNTVSNIDYSKTSIAVANKVLPSIVGISVNYSVNDYFGKAAQAEAAGSGIIVSEDGYILTNNHVVNSSGSSSYYQITEATSINVTLYGDDEEYEAKIIGSDTQTDLAVIKIEKKGLTAAQFGDSDSVQVGEFAMAIGNPLGLQSSISAGIISATNRDVTDSDTGITYNLIQTDAAINSGNSGGALVNADGNVIGINTLKLSGTGVEGIGFAIPINSTLDVYNQLITNGKVLRPFIGIEGIDISEKMSEHYNLPVGIYVKSVTSFSAAEKAGIKIGDVITAIDGTSIKTMDELNAIKNSHKIGDEITLKITRSEKQQEIKLKLQEQD